MGSSPPALVSTGVRRNQATAATYIAATAIVSSPTQPKDNPGGVRTPRAATAVRAIATAPTRA